MNSEQILDYVTYSSYRVQRVRNPEKSPEFWASAFPDWQSYEVRYQVERERHKEFVQSQCDRWYTEGRVGL